MALASNGNGNRLRAAASAPPWIMPQSSNSWRPPARTMWQEPVTSPAAPKNSNCMRAYLNIGALRCFSASPPREIAMSQAIPRIDRRQFIVGSAAAGAGLYVGICLARNRFDTAAAPGTTFAPNAFLRIAPDDTVTVIIGKSEMGQGIYTGLAMVVAEELDVDPRRVHVE